MPVLAPEPEPRPGSAEPGAPPPCLPAPGSVGALAEGDCGAPAGADPPGYLAEVEHRRLRDEEAWRAVVAWNREAVSGRRRLREGELAQRELEAQRQRLRSRGAAVRQAAARGPEERPAGARPPAAQEAQWAEEIRQQYSGYLAQARLPRPEREDRREEGLRERLEDYRARIYTGREKLG